MKVFNLGELHWKQTQLVYHTLAYMNIECLLLHSTKQKYVCVGLHQDPRTEIDIDYCKKNIFLPLEMYNTSFNLSELDIDNVAIPYHYNKDNGQYLQINELSIDSKIHPSKYWKIFNYVV